MRERTVAERARFGAGSGSLRSGNCLSRGTPTFCRSAAVLARSIERGDDHQVVFDRGVLGDRPDRHAEELAAAVLIEDRDRLHAGFLQRQIGELGGLAAAVDRDALACRRAVLHRLAQVLPHLAVEMQRVIHELVGEPRLLGDAARRDQVRDPVGLHVDALDVALVDHPLEIDVGEPEGDAQLLGHAALRDARVLVHGLQQSQVAMCFNVHGFHVRFHVPQRYSW